MIERNRWIGLLALAVVAGCGGEAAANGGEDPENGAGESTALVQGAARVINVETRTVEAGAFEETIRLTGAAVANQDVTISAEESGVIRSIVRDKGTEVQAGDWLIKIDDEILKSQVAEARAQAELAQQTWERRKRLYEEDGAGSELAYLEARYGAEQAQARLATLEERLARTVVRAPIDGIFEERHVEVGTMVSPGAQIGRVVELDPIKIVAGVPERYAADVAVNARVSVHFPVLEESYEGTVGFVGATVNPRNRTFTVEIVMENPRGIIKPEMVANVELVRQTLENAIVVPQEALVRVEEGFKVFVVEDGVAFEQPVETGPSQNNFVVIESGLTVGDQLVVVGQKQVASGDRVNVVGTR